MQIIPDERNWQQKNDTPQPLGRMLVPEGQSYEESETKPRRGIPVPVDQDYEEKMPEPMKRRRRNTNPGQQRRRLITHLIILGLLLAMIIVGLSYFFSDGQRQPIPQPQQNQTDSIK